MDKEREIENIKNLFLEKCANCPYIPYGTPQTMVQCATCNAQAIVEAGYGDTKQVLREFAEKVKERLEQYRLKNEEQTESGEWQLDSSQFCIDVVCNDGLIDRLLAEVTEK